MASRRSKILLRTAVGGSLAGLVALIMMLAYRSDDGLVVWAAGCLASVGCVFEITRMGRVVTRGMGVALWLGLLAALAPGVLHYFPLDWLDTSSLYPGYLDPQGITASYLAGATAFLVGTFVITGGRARPALSLGLSLWVFAPLTAITFIWSEYGPDGLLALLLLSKMGDIFGYYVGSAIGKSHPFPNISPGKTTAGCVASLLAGTLMGGLCVQLGLLPSAEWGLAGGFLAGALINLAAQAGDLVESRLKRLAKVKDSGVWFGPSGGMLDLADSLLLSVPAALLTWPLLFG